MYRQKSVIFTIGKTLYIENTHFWGKIQKKKRVSSIYKKTPIISVSIVYIGKHTYWARYKRKERVLYRQNTLYIRKTPIIMPYI